MFKQSMKLILVIAALITMVLIAIVVTRPAAQPSPPPPPRLTIEQIQNLWSLVTARVQVADVILVEQQGVTGGLQVAAAIKGDYLIEIDLARARLEQVDPLGRRAVLALPPPAATACRVDLERSRLFGLGSYGLWQITPGDAGYTTVTNKAYRQAQEAVATAATNPQALLQARHHAEVVLTTFLRALGWEVIVRWQDHPATGPSEPQTQGNSIMKEPDSRAALNEKLAELRSRLTDSIGYLAARRWLSAAEEPPPPPQRSLRENVATNESPAEAPSEEPRG